ncbi:hypothetical protein B4Q13_23900, partial [Lacticaseibacillus rhamnosus]
YGNGNVGSSDGWVLSEIRELPNFVDNTYKNGQLDTTFALNDTLKLKGGVAYREYETEASAFSRSNGTPANVNPRLGMNGNGCAGSTASAASR